MIVVVLAGERERTLAEAALEDRDRLGEPGLADADRVERQADRVVLGLVPAGADRDVEPAVGQDVERRQVLGEDRRVAQVVVVDERRDPERVVAAATVARYGIGRAAASTRWSGRTNVVTPTVLGAAGPLAELAARSSTSNASARNGRASPGDCDRGPGCVAHHDSGFDGTSVRRMSVVDDLASLAIFADLPHEQVERLAKYAEELEVEAGEEPAHEGRYEGPCSP